MTDERPTPSELSAIAATLFTEGPPLMRALQRWCEADLKE